MKMLTQTRHFQGNVQKKKQGPENLINYAFAVFFVLVSVVKWIGNLGVVPLFLLDAFLLAPAFFAFLSLLFVVTHVLETMHSLLIYCSNYLASLFFTQNIRFKTLTIFILCVKGFFNFSPVYASQNALREVDLILRVGEAKEIHTGKLEKFNIENKGILNYHLDEKSQKLIIRGKIEGESEIIIWKKDGNGIKFKMHIISKKTAPNTLKLADQIQNLGLEVKIKSSQLTVFGTLQNVGIYLKYKKLMVANPEVIQIEDQTQLPVEVKNEILGEIYREFFNEFKSTMRCQTKNAEISCFYPSNEAPSEKLKKFFQEKYHVQFIEFSNQDMEANYTFKMKLIQFEQTDGEELRFGLNELSSNLYELMTVPLSQVISKNSILLSQKKIVMNTLAEPMGIINTQTEATFQIGSEVPYKLSQTKGDIPKVEWKFAGLKIKLKLENLGDKVRINYETELTRPSSDESGHISGNKAKSTLVTTLAAPVMVFQIVLKTDAVENQSLPYLSQIPILGELFKSKGKEQNYKIITGLLEIKKNDPSI